MSVIDFPTDRDERLAARRLTPGNDDEPWSLRKTMLLVISTSLVLWGGIIAAVGWIV